MQNNEHKGKSSEKQVNENKEKLDGLKEPMQDYKEILQRLQAEFENFKKRNERENDEFRKLVNSKVLSEFLPLVDSLSEGIKQAQIHKNMEMGRGFENVLKQLMQILERNGVEQIESAGKKFDHNLHEVLMVEKDDKKEDEIVLEELQKGYMINGKVLRPSKVKVNKRD